VLAAVVERTKVDPARFGDVVVGSVLGSNVWRANQARIAMFLAGYPVSVRPPTRSHPHARRSPAPQVPVRTLNRQCSSGLQAVADVASAIKARCDVVCSARAHPPQAGYYDMGVAAGVESMSSDPFKVDDANINPKVFENSHARGCLTPMGITSENVAAKFGVTRADQDALAAESHARAAAARAAGRFRSEIVPVRTLQKSAEGEKEVTVSEDDGIRAGVSAEQLSKLPAAFRKGGSTTAGNASQVSDAAAAVLVARRSVAAALGLPVAGVWRAFSVVGVDPEIMGIGPAVAIPAALRAAGLRVADVALFELNEAFASQALYCQRVLGLDPGRVNVNGGAIALGHPLGCTGARCVATLLAELHRRGPEERTGVVSMCIGSGMGAAAVITKD